MRRALTQSIAIVTWLACTAASGGAHGQEPARVSLSAQTVLARALANFYPDGYAHVRFINYRGKTKGLERDLDVWTKGRRVLGVFTASPAIRGTAFLVLPSAEEKTAETVPDNQYFIYMPALRRVRRISGAQRADAFFGTYLSQGDVEAHTASDFTLASMHAGSLAGEPAYELRLRPRFDAEYDWAQMVVATRDYALLRLEENRTGRKTPVRVILARRAWLLRIGTHVLPRRMVVSEGGSDGYTEVLFSDRNLHAEIPDSRFSINYLPHAEQ